MLSLLLTASLLLGVFAEPGHSNLRGSAQTEPENLDDRELARAAGVGPGGGIWFGPDSSTNYQTRKCNDANAYITKIELCADDVIRGIYKITCSSGTPNSTAVIGVCPQNSPIMQILESADGFKGATSHRSLNAFGQPSSGFASCAVFHARNSASTGNLTKILGTDCGLGVIGTTYGSNSLVFKAPAKNQVLTSPANQASNEGFAWCYSSNSDATARINKLFVKKNSVAAYPYITGLGIGCA